MARPLAWSGNDTVGVEEFDVERFVDVDPPPPHDAINTIDATAQKAIRQRKPTADLLSTNPISLLPSICAFSPFHTRVDAGAPVRQ
jgi:hypothetical protein